MSKFTNTAAGLRGINVKDDAGIRTVWLEPNETVEFEDDKIITDKTVHPDIKKGDAAAKDAAKAQTDAAAAETAAT